MTDLSAAAARQLDIWASRRAIIGLMGEFSAGKSTLANFLLGKDLLPENVTATQLPAVWVTHGTGDAVLGLCHDGRLEPVDISDLGDNPRARYLALRLETEADILNQADIVDTPGLSDPQLAKGATQFLGSRLDFVIWCTSAIQAWRYTEKQAWLGFPETLRTRSLIVMTRADKVRRATDLSKVLRRVKIETGGLFAHVLPLDTPAAAAAQKLGDTSEAWVKSGGKALMETLHQSIDGTLKQTQKLPNAPEDIVTGTDETSAVAVPDQLPDAADNMRVDMRVETAADASQVSVVQMFLDTCARLAPIETRSQTLSLLDQFGASIRSHTHISPAHRATVELCLCIGEEANVDVTKLLEQIEMEVQDFDTQGRYQLLAT